MSSYLEADEDEDEEENNLEQDQGAIEDIAAPPEGATLATTEFVAEGLPFDGKIWTVKAELTISEHQNFKSCRDYGVGFRLERTGEASLEVGYGIAIRIDKNVLNDKCQERWIGELLQPKRCKRRDLTRHAHGGHKVSEVERYAQMYYEKDGSLRVGEDLDRVRQSMPAARQFLAIQDCMLEKPFRGKGLSKWCMFTFLAAVAHAPKEHAYTGYVFLSSAAFAHVYDEVATERHAIGLAPKPRLTIEAAL